MNDESWQAIVLSDSSYDSKFYYGVITTGIYCRPSCKSRVPVRKNVKLFENHVQAIAENFRPCKRCKPDGVRLPIEEWVAQIVQIINSRFAEALTLGKLAEIFHGSPYHLQRTFKRVQGMSPAAYILRTRINKARELLVHTELPVTDIAFAVGIPNSSHFSTQFHAQTGSTPTNYRKSITHMSEDYREVIQMRNKGEEQIIYYAYITHEDRQLVIAATLKGLCYVGSWDQSLAEMKEWASIRMNVERFEQDEKQMSPYTQQLEEYFLGKRTTFTLPLDLQGTSFQLEVWGAMGEVPYGKTASYHDVAQKLQKPLAVRAVGTAIGRNPVLIVAPCHRIIGKNGQLTGYRGGLEMKEQLLKLENATKA
jgi:O-6-methylguanine DNA methyltransferase